MVSPLSPLSPQTTNARSALSANRTPNFKPTPVMDTTSAHAIDIFDEDIINWDEGPSSPFLTEVADQENRVPALDLLKSSPSKQQSPRKFSRPASPPDHVTSGEPTTLKEPERLDVVQDGPGTGNLPQHAKDLNTLNDESATEGSSDAGSVYTPPESEPEVPASSPTERPMQMPSPAKRPASNSQDLRDNEGLTITMTRMEQESHVSPKKQSRAASPSVDCKEDLTTTTVVMGQQQNDCVSGNDELDYDQDITTLTADDTNIDDTCFSNFSAVPDMTLFAKLGARSPTKTFIPDFGSARTPRGTGRTTPNTARRYGFTFDHSPRPHPAAPKPNPARTTTQPTCSTSPTNSTPSPTSRGAPQPAALPPNQPQPPTSALHPSKNRNLLNLLDFELPPAPTPRSIPTHTVREVESMKSLFQSQISALEASLSGKEAEVTSLKKAVGDAERRVGEALEAVREERSAREHAEKEKLQWERQGKEVESVLRAVKAEVISAEKEREEVLRKLEAAERRADECQMRAIEAESRASEAENRVADVADQTLVETEAQEEGREPRRPSFTPEQQRYIDQQMAKMGADLHEKYRDKHLRKVADVKRSYEKRAEKKTAELNQQIEELTRKNEELSSAKDGTFSGVSPAELSAALGKEREAYVKSMEEQRAEIDEQRARLAGLGSEIESVRRSHAQLVQELEQERVEKGELVAAVDEMLALQADFGAPAAGVDIVEDFRKSISRPSGLRGPGFAGESRLGRPSAPSGLSRGVSKSKIMSNIERMGSGRAVQ
ncbi:hypothetical protein H2199_000324 [Coniosporium tulheliwenetii]|uniref:Uncharacterized protein n=1 Tax=Coniosporium tulheliwenetii TaxID=3383036 RepID=A0ACC2ZPV3_9PEZI|nr:hypothetical protein H2199_000324 [Cladosporium sp. JES 115]